MSVNNLPPEFVQIMTNEGGLTLPYRKFFDNITNDISNLQDITENVPGAAVADSTAVSVADLVSDFNDLLTSLRDAGIIAP